MVAHSGCTLFQHWVGLLEHLFGSPSLELSTAYSIYSQYKHTPYREVTLNFRSNIGRLMCLKQRWDLLLCVEHTISSPWVRSSYFWCCAAWVKRCFLCFDHVISSIAEKLNNSVCGKSPSFLTAFSKPSLQSFNLLYSSVEMLYRHKFDVLSSWNG